MSYSLLIVDDERSLLEVLEVLFRGEGFEVSCADSMAAARRLLAERSPDLVISDILMPDGSGLELLEEIQRGTPSPPVIMMTAHSSIQSAVEAMRLGAQDYLSKPLDLEEVKVVAEKALERATLERENAYLRRELADKYTSSRIIGRSAPMQGVFSLIERVARTSSTTLIQGESGTGKELVARAIHFSSARAKRPFLSVNCGALPETLLESELFGHVRGAFTGALRDKKGLFQEVEHGTLFLDEIGEMTPTMQVKLLRAIQEKRIRRVGGNVEQEVDVRIIAATNQNLEESIAAGEFREDLYYRINVIPIHLPPLRERREDIPLLVDHFLRKRSEEMGLEPKRITSEAMRLLESYSWPGNVRELENLVERALALSTAPAIHPGDLPEQLLEQRRTVSPVVELPNEGLDLEGHLDLVREKLMREALERTGGVQTKAAELLGMSFRSFRYYAKKVGLRGDGEDEMDEGAE